MASIRKQKIEAFTILETLIALILLALVILIGSSLFNIVNRWYINFLRKTDDLTEITTAYTQLKWDIQSSNSWVFERNQLQLYQYPDQSKFLWLIKDGNLCRVNNTDTLVYDLDGFFSVKANVISFYRNSDEATFLIRIPKYCEQMKNEN